MNIFEAVKELKHNGKMKIKNSDFYVYKNFNRSGKNQLYYVSKNMHSRYYPEFEHIINENWELYEN